jgi:hypothetical protein
MTTPNTPQVQAMTPEQINIAAHDAYRHAIHIKARNSDYAAGARYAAAGGDWVTAAALRLAAITADPQPGHMTSIGTGVYLTPSDAAMTRENLAAWLQARGVHDGAYLDELLSEHAGKTEDEMDRIYDETHPTY